VAVARENNVPVLRSPPLARAPCRSSTASSQGSVRTLPWPACSSSWRGQRQLLVRQRQQQLQSVVQPAGRCFARG
jgi:hypothetical protein